MVTRHIYETCWCGKPGSLEFSKVFMGPGGAEVHVLSCSGAHKELYADKGNGSDLFP